MIHLVYNVVFSGLCFANLSITGRSSETIYCNSGLLCKQLHTQHFVNRSRSFVNLWDWLLAKVKNTLLRTDRTGMGITVHLIETEAGWVKTFIYLYFVHLPVWGHGCICTCGQEHTCMQNVEPKCVCILKTNMFVTPIECVSVID